MMNLSPLVSPVGCWPVPGRQKAAGRHGGSKSKGQARRPLNNTQQCPQAAAKAENTHAVQKKSGMQQERDMQTETRRNDLEKNPVTRRESSQVMKQLQSINVNGTRTNTPIRLYCGAFNITYLK